MSAFSERPGGGERPARDVAVLVAPLSRPGVRLVPMDGPSSSWCGGCPHVPTGFAWPRPKGEPLAFLAQLDLAQVARACELDWLPHEGSLVVFYDVVRQPWGFDPSQSGAWLVERVVGPTSELPFPEDLAPACRLPRRSLAMRRVLVPPSSKRPAVRALELDEREREQLAAYHAALFDDGPRHLLGGFPAPVQGDEMERGCQLVTNGLPLSGPADYSDPRRKGLEAGAADWRLLLQLDSDSRLGIEWGDAGRIYFWVREEEARRGDFDGVWTMLQCT